MGLGLVAAKAIRRGDAVLTIPDRLAITTESALRSELLGPYLAEFEPQLADYAFIAVALLNEERLGDQSPLAPWLSSASRATSLDVPLLWPDEAQLELEQSTAAPFAERRACAKADYEWLQTNVFDQSPMVFPSSVFSEAAFLRAVAEVISRAAFIVPESAEAPARLALMPLLEFANHAVPPSANLGFRSASAGFLGRGEAPAAVQLLAIGDIAEGQAVCTKYADATQGELLIDYGFIREPVRFRLVKAVGFCQPCLEAQPPSLVISARDCKAAVAQVCRRHPGRAVHELRIHPRACALPISAGSCPAS
jgi:hypothetical protein